MASRGGRSSGVPFVLVGLIVALLVGTVVSHFATSTPDALQRVIIDSACEDAATEEACLAEQEGEPVLGFQPGFLFDYGVAWLSGLVGVALCFVLGAGVVLLLRRGRGSSGDAPPRVR